VVWWSLFSLALGVEPDWRCLGPEPLTDVWSWVGAEPRRGALPLPPEEADTCWGPVLAERVVRPHVIVEHPPEVDAALAVALADAVEHALVVQVDEMGWRAPPGSERFRLAVYLNEADLPGAATTEQDCDGEPMPLMVVPVSALLDEVVLAEVAAHETNHALQLAYGQAAPFWLWEATATWMEPLVTASSGWLAFVEVWARRPELGLEEGDRRVAEDFLHMYGRAAWLREVERAAGQEQVRGLWEAASTLGGRRFSLDLPALAGGAGLDLAGSVEAFAVAMAEEDFSGGLAYPEIAGTSLADEAGEGAVEVGGWGQTHLRVAPVSGQFERRLQIVADDDAAWSVAVVGADGVAHLARWTSEQELLLGDEEVAVVVARLSAEPGRVGWTLLRTAVGGEEPPTACGCRTGPAGQLLWALPVWIVRRRKAVVATRGPGW
jgi:hypothetical protein